MKRSEIEYQIFKKLLNIVLGILLDFSVDGDPSWNLSWYWVKRFHDFWLDDCKELVRRSYSVLNEFLKEC